MLVIAELKEDTTVIFSEFPYMSLYSTHCTVTGMIAEELSPAAMSDVC